MSQCRCRTKTGYCDHRPRPVSLNRGSAKRRARAIARRENVRRIVERIEGKS